MNDAHDEREIPEEQEGPGSPPPDELRPPDSEPEVPPSEPVEIEVEAEEPEIPPSESACPICDRLIPFPTPEHCPHCSAHLESVTELIRMAELSIAEAVRDISIGDLESAERRLDLARTTSSLHRLKAEIINAGIIRLRGHPGKALAHLVTVADELDRSDAELVELFEETFEQCKRDGADLAACCEHYNFALFEARRGHFEEARRSLQKALNLVPHHASSHALLGKVLLGLGMEGEARHHLNRALAIDPTCRSASGTLAKMGWSLHRSHFHKFLQSLNLSPQTAGSVFVVVVLLLIALSVILSRI